MKKEMYSEPTFEKYEYSTNDEVSTLIISFNTDGDLNDPDLYN